MSALLDLFTAVALVLGALFFLAGVVGLLRFPDTLSRLRAHARHAAGEVLLGIGSGVLLDDETAIPQGSAYVQVASYRSWIDATMAGSGQQAIWVSSIPEPSSLLLCALGGMAILARRTGQPARNG